MPVVCPGCQKLQENTLATSSAPGQPPGCGGLLFQCFVGFLLTESDNRVAYLTHPAQQKKNIVQRYPYSATTGCSVLRFVVMQAVFGLAAWFCGQWLLLISWYAAVGILFPFFATIRQLLEHRDELAAGATTYYEHTRNRISRLFGNGFFSRTFGAAGFNRHLLHHWDPQISYTRYNELYHFLLEAPATRGIVKDAQTSYVRTVLKLFRLS
jgi:fatty acid desaturase